MWHAWNLRATSTVTLESRPPFRSNILLHQIQLNAYCFALSKAAKITYNSKFILNMENAMFAEMMDNFQHFTHLAHKRWSCSLNSNQEKRTIRKTTVLTRSVNPLATSRCLRLVSPSKLQVSIKHSPWGSLDRSNRISAGITSLLERWMRSPTLTLFQRTFL